jgi:N-acetylmuramate 1-kinase
VTIQEATAAASRVGCICAGLAFDEAKLKWELGFFFANYVNKYLGRKLDPATANAVNAEFRALCSELAGRPRVLTHRDYHSRNLMMQDGRPIIIDFQDARMGPDTYDLASLLRDSYVDLAPQQVDELIAFFLALNGQSTHDQEFRRRFDLMSLQRNLKALGTFGYMTTSRNNTVYIQYIPRTLAHVKTNLAKYPRFERLRGLLEPWL